MNSTILTYKTPQDEEKLSEVLADWLRFGISNIVICLPSAWRQYRTELSAAFPGDIAYVTEKTIEASVRGSNLKHVTELAEIAC